ncbi:hypothetical protein FFF93_014920 [Arthrobacter sp. KBS0702]|uniref:hypothetical protein n=1 Tax=Arthrobacter sp. KBS0702 TaxID=2578107 RepID=UPI00110ED1B1|nr:hypothetical protein [Arthrobacter sp. KBS0702]QDW30917.1 hypothetical protein FFF93_014920 [Arthrobacter sp. KBS0702]
MAIDLDCSTCLTDEYVVRVEMLSGTQRRLKCEHCGFEWLRGEPERQKIPLPTLEDIKKRFPKPGDVDPVKLARANELKSEFLKREPEPEPNVAPYWAKYQQVFSAEGLPNADPLDLKAFANSNVGANPGNMSVFNEAWNEMGAETGAAQVRKAVEYLLRGTSPADLEDRLTALIKDTTPFSMKGFKESLLTKVLCIVDPERYLTILMYTGVAGKREIARSLWGLELPDPERVDWTIGRLILWSNDLLLALLGDGFRHQQHASEFLWWAKDKA